MKFKYKVRRDKHVKADFLCLILILKCFLLQLEVSQIKILFEVSQIKILIVVSQIKFLIVVLNRCSLFEVSQSLSFSQFRMKHPGEVLQEIVGAE